MKFELHVERLYLRKADQATTLQSPPIDIKILAHALPAHHQFFKRWISYFGYTYQTLSLHNLFVSYPNLILTLTGTCLGHNPNPNGDGK